MRILGGECPCIALTMGARPGDGGARPPTPGKQLNGVRALGVKERWGLDSEVSHGASCQGTQRLEPSTFYRTDLIVGGIVVRWPLILATDPIPQIFCDERMKGIYFRLCNKKTTDRKSVV